MTPLVIYHANCLDGFGAACAAFEHFREGDQCACQFQAASHGDPPPDCAGREVYLLDFSYKREVLESLCRQALKITVIDHHISAMQDLAGLDQQVPNLKMIFDLDKSGAVLAWEFFHDTPVPDLLRYVQDRDLWRFQLADSSDVTAALMSYPYDFLFWGDLLRSSEAVELLAGEGRAINRYRRQLIEYYKRKAVLAELAGFQVPVVNCPPAIASELLGELAEGRPFAAGYHDQGERRGWSLRSREGGENVALIAERFGGGGHPRAAGFSSALPDNPLTPATLLALSLAS